ncbi:flagellar regulator YcgR PilZN domain-containing protein [Rugamonas sp. CCM 8940]|uniref:flagellar regulator YcgR PilZN domain-containing protein n=1 Tax=Rugamonas sp. CCM 8940 TaxID=2765359 RepID=UPI00361588BC
MLINEHTAVPIRKGPPRPQDAIAPIPAAASSHEMTSEDEIGDTLTLLAASGDAISMYVSGTREAVLGRILSVDPDLPHFVIELNEGATLTPGKITFVAVLRTAKLQFRLSNMDWNSVPGSPQLIPMVFPEVSLVLDRRSSERVETPLGTNFTASLETHGTFYEWSVIRFLARRDRSALLKERSEGFAQRPQTAGCATGTGRGNRPRHRTGKSLHARLPFLPAANQIHIGCTFSNMTPEVESQIKSLMDQLDHAHRQR